MATRGIRIGNDDFYLFDYHSERQELVVTKSNVRNAVGKELFKCLAKRKKLTLEVSVMTQSQVNKAEKS